MTPSVTTFGYNENRSGQVISHIHSNHPIYLKELSSTNEITKGAEKLTPLYVNGFRSNNNNLKDRRVLVFSDYQKLYAYDIDRSETLWDVSIPRKHALASTPVIDLELGWIYFYTIHYAYNREITHTVYQVDLNGENIQKFPIDMNNIFQKKYPNINYSGWSKHLHCKTALGLNKNVNPANIFFACSIRTGAHKNEKYGTQKGLSGLVISIQLDSKGAIKGKSGLNVFHTSASDDSRPATGFDTGVYNSGSGPSLLPDGSILTATGNGPVFLDRDNYGCSIVRLDGRTLRPKSDNHGNPLAFSHSRPPYNECWLQNIEYANSSVASIEYNDKSLAAVMTKDGNLDLFDPKKMNPNRSNVQRFEIGRMSTYGQPAMFKRKNSIRIYAQAFNQPENSKYTDTLLADGSALKKIKDVSKVSCYGWLSSVPTGSSKQLSLLYSGPIRNDYALAFKNTPLYNNITSIFTDSMRKSFDAYTVDSLWAPYIPIADLGYSFSPSKKPNIKKTRMQLTEPLEIYLDSPINKKKITTEDFWILRNLDKDRDCNLKNSPSLLPIYQVERHYKNKGKNNTLTAFDFNLENEKAQMSWVYELQDHEILTRTHPVVSTDSNNEHPVVIVLINHMQDSKGRTSTLLLIDGETGKKIQKVPFKGDPHFSMPLVFDEKIVVPTKKHGLKIFSLAPEWHIMKD